MSNISSADLEARKGSPSPRLDEDEFRRRFLNQFQDPAYEPLTPELTKISAAAKNSRKSPRTRKAGAEFADPDYNLAADWLDARQAIHEAKRRHGAEGVRRVFPTG